MAGSDSNSVSSAHEYEWVIEVVLEALRPLRPSIVFLVGSQLHPDRAPSDIDLVVVAAAYEGLPLDLRRGMTEWPADIPLDIQAMTVAEFDELYPAGSDAWARLLTNGRCIYGRRDGIST